MANDRSPHDCQGAVDDRNQDEVGRVLTGVGVIMLGVLLWRTRAIPAWAAAALPIGVIANVVAFSIANQAVLAGSYLLLLIAFTPAAAALRARPTETTRSAGDSVTV